MSGENDFFQSNGIDCENSKDSICNIESVNVDNDKCNNGANVTNSSGFGATEDDVYFQKMDLRLSSFNLKLCHLNGDLNNNVIDEEKQANILEHYEEQADNGNEHKHFCKLIDNSNCSTNLLIDHSDSNCTYGTIENNVCNHNGILNNQQDNINNNNCLKYTKDNRSWNHVLIVLSISFWSYIGLIIRFYLGKLVGPYTQYTAFSSLWAEFIGSFLMAKVVSHKTFIQKYDNALYVGLGTGLCGSITTFSSWMSESAKVLLVWKGVDLSHGAAFRIFSWCTIIIAGLAISLAGLYAGFHISKLSPLHNDKPRYTKLRKTTKKGTIANWTFIISTFAFATVAVLFLPYILDDHVLFFSCVFAPFGALLRFYLGKFMNKPDFPLGTFIANIFGVIVISVMTLLPIVAPIHDVLVTSLITGVANGFCGCLTTVSTFVVELSTLELKQAYFYGLLSIITAQCIFVLVLGVYTWLN